MRRHIGTAKVPLALYREEEIARVSSGSEIAKSLMDELSMTHPGLAVVDFPCSIARYAAYPGLLAIKAAQLGFPYTGVDGSPRAVEMADKRTRRMLKKHNVCGKVRYEVADHEQVFTLFEDQSVALAIVLEWFLHMEEEEIASFLRSLMIKIAPGGYLFFSLTPSEINTMRNFDKTRTRLAPSSEALDIMCDWDRIAIPSHLERVAFFPKSCAAVRVKPEQVLNCVFQKPYT